MRAEAVPGPGLDSMTCFLSPTAPESTPGNPPRRSPRRHCRRGNPGANPCVPIAFKKSPAPPPPPAFPPWKPRPQSRCRNPRRSLPALLTPKAFGLRRFLRSSPGGGWKSDGIHERTRKRAVVFVAFADCPPRLTGGNETFHPVSERASDARSTAAPQDCGKWPAGFGSLSHRVPRSAVRRSAPPKPEA